MLCPVSLIFVDFQLFRRTDINVIGHPLILVWFKRRLVSTALLLIKPLHLIF